MNTYSHIGIHLLTITYMLFVVNGLVCLYTSVPHQTFHMRDTNDCIDEV